MDIRGKTIQNGKPTPENPVEIENEINILLAIEILKKIKSKVTLVKVDDENELEGEIYEANKDIAQKCIVLFPIN